MLRAFLVCITIVSKVSGGLGNQLFGYAAARAVALRNNTTLVLDASKYLGEWDASSTRPFLLDYFPVKASFGHLGPVMERRSLIERAFRRLSEDFFSQEIDRDRGSFGYLEEFKKISSRARTKGYFISPRFFDDWWCEIRNELSLPKRFFDITEDTIGKEFLSKIKRTETIGVHIRRGDFLTYDGPVKLYLRDFEDYLRGAIDYFANRISPSTFVIVSDDRIWSEAFFRKLGVMFQLSPDGGDARIATMRDFYLLSECDHQIMSNSTFSWWAAWLGHRQGRQVLMPPRWDEA